MSDGHKQVVRRGVQVSMEGFDLIRLRDSLCPEHWGVQDNAGLLQQLGAMPPG